MFEEIMNIVLSNILEVIISIISLIVARYAIPYIRSDLIPWLKEKRVYSIVKSFVQAVEKLAESGAIAKVDKNAKVVELLEANGIIVDETVKAFIESAVKELDLVTSAVYEEIVNAEE